MRIWPALTKPVYVVVPGQCANACLDALDVFTRFPNTKLIGAPSSFDSTYMEVRTQTLDSGLAAVIIPNKVYVHRARANGQVYQPAIYINDVDIHCECAGGCRKRPEGASQVTNGPAPSNRLANAMTAIAIALRII